MDLMQIFTIPGLDQTERLRKKREESQSKMLSKLRRQSATYETMEQCLKGSRA